MKDRISGNIIISVLFWLSMKGEQMKKVLDYFTIDGEFGGNQDWFTNLVMRIGGCGAATACDSCIYLGLKKDMKELYPFDIQHLTRDDYKRFSQVMKPYIRPRAGGVKKLAWYIDGFQRYIDDVNKQMDCDLNIRMQEFAGAHTYEEAAEVIQKQIDKGYPIPYLMLRHKDRKFKDFIWHWFLLVGYEEKDDGLNVVAATYGEATRICLRELWDTGHDEKGGIVVYSV